jgi:hypothetical protein
VGLPLSLKPGEHFIEASDASQVRKKFFEIRDKEYSTQHITIKDKRKVNPYASDMDRILAEKARKQKARNRYTRVAVDVDFLLPVEGVRSGSYGPQAAQRHGHRRQHWHAGAQPQRGRGYRVRRFLFQRQPGVHRPWPGPDFDVRPPQ